MGSNCLKMHDSCSFYIALHLSRPGKIVDRLNIPSQMIIFLLVFWFFHYFISAVPQKNLFCWLIIQNSLHNLKLFSSSCSFFVQKSESTQKFLWYAVSVPIYENQSPKAPQNQNLQIHSGANRVGNSASNLFQWAIPQFTSNPL